MQTEEGRGKRKERTGVVLSTKMNKSVVVAVTRTLRHPRLGKVIKLSKKYYAHDEDNSAKVGDKVTIMETRPLSKTKRWRIVQPAAA